MTKRPFFSVAFNSNVERHDMPDAKGKERELDFVLDLDSVRFPRNPCVVDYDHDTKEPIGAATLSVEEGQIVARGDFVSAIEGDRAFSIAETCADVPYGVSPTLDLSRAQVESIPEGETGVANGRVYQGPVFIYRNAAVLGISVCPLPTDCQTTVAPLNASDVVKLSRTKARFIMSDELNNVEEPIPVDEKTVEKLGDETGAQEGAQEVRDKELQEFIDEFGLEKGVGFFQSSLTLDEARMEDYRELKRLSQSPPCDSGEKKEELACDPEPDDKKELATLNADLKKSLSIFNGLVAKLSRGVDKIGAQTSPRANFAPKVEKRTYAESVAAAVRR